MWNLPLKLGGIAEASNDPQRRPYDRDEECDRTRPLREAYYDLMLQFKEATETPEQENCGQVYGDFCAECVANGRASAHLLRHLVPVQRKQVQRG